MAETLGGGQGAVKPARRLKIMVTEPQAVPQDYGYRRYGGGNRDTHQHSRVAAAQQAPRARQRVRGLEPLRHPLVDEAQVQPGRFPRPLYPEGLAGQGEGGELAGRFVRVLREGLSVGRRDGSRKEVDDADVGAWQRERGDGGLAPEHLNGPVAPAK